MCYEKRTFPSAIDSDFVYLCRFVFIDCTNGLSEGPFSPERAGSLPTLDLVDLAFAGRMDKKQLQKYLVGEGGLYAYLQTKDVQRAEETIRGGDEEAKFILEAMAYQIAKDIGAMCVVLKGAVDGIILTGGMAHSEMVTGSIREWVEFLAPVFVFPGENEMTALAEGGLRVFLHEEEIKKYPDAGALGICVPPRDGLLAPKPQ
jgi:butyrate kinase